MPDVRGPESQVVPWSRAGARRAALQQELAFAYSMGEYEPDGKAVKGHVIPRRSDSKLTERLSGDQKATLESWSLHEKLIDEAVEGYQRFRKAMDRVAEQWFDTLIDWVERTRELRDAIGWLKEEQENPEQPDLSGVGMALEDLRVELGRWRLAPEAGPAPMLNPFAVALALGLEQAARWHRMRKPLGLAAVPGLAGGSFLQGLAYARLWDRYGGTPPGNVLEKALGLKVAKPGHGRMGQYQLQDAQWWVLVHIGDVKLSRVAWHSNKTYQELQRSFRNTERALGFRK